MTEETSGQKGIPNTDAMHPLGDASVGRALLILVIALLALLAAVALTPVKHIENQHAAAVAADPFAGIVLEGKSAVVIDTVSGATLYAKNPEVQLPLASLTKVALALVVRESVPLDSMITIPYYVSGSRTGAHLLKGERWSIKDIIDFTLVESSNGGAALLADVADEHLRARGYDGSDASHSAVLARMNELATTLGLTQTYYHNVSGLDLSVTEAGAYGSALDMAKLFADRKSVV